MWRSAGGLGGVVLPRSAEELSVAIIMSLANFRHLVELRNQLNQADKDIKDRLVIVAAKRWIRQNLNCPDAEAMRTMQFLSRNLNMKLADLARQVLRTRKLPPA
jgi:AmiR/NasT family two-component response regulator